MSRDEVKPRCCFAGFQITREDKDGYCVRQAIGTVTCPSFIHESECRCGSPDSPAFVCKAHLEHCINGNQKTEYTFVPFKRSSYTDSVIEELTVRKLIL